MKVYERLVILNHMVSRSSSKAGQEFTPPTHSAEELLGIVEMRRLLGFAVEYLGATDDTDEAIRAANGLNHDFIRLKNSYSIEEDGRKYIVLFFESANQMEKSLSVIHQRNFRGRQISGDEDEVGASTAHVVVRLPANGEYDDGSYRCAIEHVSGGVTRKNISALLRRQLRRHARAEDWTFEIYRKN
ncbi:hypothetical protein MKK55_09765 [Methylobacterium sp. J-059]|uniref:hypothetical protein n=1 Tax=Methylobacterium sp. J-059 TaxID=2836643 RepID=UPI001FBA8C32|nr:hypothetical protein [Methylobacterium sp. J-059]MCJ2039226.1 hypothetical protein [Methylobacterium sp. J-059]